MRKIIIVLGVILIVGIVYNKSNISNVTPLQFVESYGERWGLAIEEPQEIKQIWSNYGSHGDGEAYNLLTYKENLLPVDTGFQAVSTENRQEVQAYIATFMGQTKNTYLGNEKLQTAFVQAIKDNPIVVEVGDFYFHSSENDGYDTVTAIYHAGDKKISLLEWHQ